MIIQDLQSMEKIIIRVTVVLWALVQPSLSADYFCSQFYENITSRDFLRLTVDDNTPVGTAVLKFDRPWDPRSAVAFVAGDISYISFDHDNYEIKVVSPLYPKIGQTLRLLGTCIDYIHLYNYEIKLDLTILVYINDINNPPSFANLPNATIVPENSPVGSVVFQLSLDESLDYEESFKTAVIEILSVTDENGPPQNPPFLLNGDLQVVLRSALDYEVGPRSYDITFFAEDGADPPLSNTGMLSVLIGDVDDMSPQFSHSSYRVEVIGERPVEERECVDTEPTLVAVDGDGEASSPIFYSITEGSQSEYWSEYFDLERVSGKLCQLKTMPRLGLDLETGREIFHNFTFTVRAFQEDNPDKFDEASLFLEVTDSNEHAPEFERKLYRLTMTEWPEVAPGERIAQLLAFDKDHGVNSEFEYSLSEDVSHLLWIEPTTGWLVAKNSTLFDRESWERVEFKVFAEETMTNERKKTSARVQLTLEDANDNPPVFISQHMEVIIKDNTRPGSMIHQKHETLRAVDRDSGDNGDVIYKLQEVARVGGTTSLVDHGRFTVDPDHGYVNLAGSLADLRRKRQHPTFILTISATDRARNESNRMSAFATMTVHIQEANDFPPVVKIPDSTKRTIIHVNESAAIGAIVAQLEISDEDGDEDIYLKYRITDKKARDIFSFNSGGVLVIKDTLDRESESKYNFRIKITDGVHTVKSDVTVIVEDSNDNKPSFTQEEYRFTLRENPQIGQEVGQVTASDPDEGPNGRVTYSLENRTDEQAFEIREDGSIFVGKKSELFDREKISELKFKVYASDAGQVPLTSSANVIVELEDINDNLPVFSSPSYHGTLDEDDANPKPQLVTLDIPINATDGDIDFHHRNIRYSLTGSGSELFLMNPVRADLVVRRPGSLDCEKKCSYLLEIHATDEGGNGTRVTSSLVIELRDVNDESPRFVGHQRFRVNDDTIDAVVGIIKAKDDDVTPPNNNVLYILKRGGYGKFNIDYNTGEVKVSGDLDNEPVSSSYSLLVEAVDGGMPRRSQQTNITISVPVNTAPTIMKNTTYFRIAEDSSLNATVGQIIVTDHGVTSRSNFNDDDEDDSSFKQDNVGLATDPSAREKIAKLNYFIKDLTVPFTVNDKGHLFTKSSLDRETISSYVFDVFVSNNGVPSRTSSAEVTVEVTDVNDHPPRWLSPFFQGRVTEDDADPIPGQKVIMLSQNIKAGDDDSTANSSSIRYTLRGDGSQYFSVDPISGHLSVSPLGVGKIDREKSAFHKFKVVATDDNGRGLSAAADVIIEVEDVNDVTPRFNQRNKHVVINTKVAPGQIIDRVRAVDSDATQPNNQVIYSLAGGGMGKFSVDADTGSVIVQRGIYFQPRQESYILEIVARDLGYPNRFATGTVTVKILHQKFNDYKPEFQGRTIFHTFEEVPVGTIVGRLNTVDEDVGAGEEVTLYINAEDNVPFVIDSATGEIATAARLDCDGGGPRDFTFSVIARDQGDPPKTTMAYVGIIVDDINDNPPTFTQEVYDHSISEVFPPQTIVATPFAFDEIDTMQTIYNYEMHGPGADTFFHMDPDTGVVRTTELIKTLNDTNLQFWLVATDVYNPDLKATALLRLTVYKSNGKPCCCLVPCGVETP